MEKPPSPRLAWQEKGEKSDRADRTDKADKAVEHTALSALSALSLFLPLPLPRMEARRRSVPPCGHSLEMARELGESRIRRRKECAEVKESTTDESIPRFLAFL